MLCPRAKLLVMVLPLLVDTAEWNTECSLKPVGSTAPANSKVRCTASGGCKVTCKRGYTFPLGERQIYYKCRDGHWQLEGGDPIYYKECIPFCKPACMNGGHCIAPHTCQCPEGWHGRACRRAPAGTVSCSPPCENGGFCIMTNTCECLEGYTGETCHDAVKLVTTSTRPIEYSTSIIKQPIEIPANVPDTTTTTTEPTTSHATTTEIVATTFTTSSTSTKRTTMVVQVVDTNTSTTTTSPTITQLDSSLDTEIMSPTVSSVSSEIVTADLFESVSETNNNSSTAPNGHRSPDYGYDVSKYGVDTEDPASDRLDAVEDMDYREDDIDAKLQMNASTQGGCSCLVPWLSQTIMTVLLILLMK